MLKIGQIFENKFELLEVLGAGGIGTVYKAMQLDCNRIVAVKILHEKTSAEEEETARFLQEARALSQLSHKNIVAVYHLGISEEQNLYMVMEYIQGISLQQVLSKGRLPLPQAIRIMRALSEALLYVHNHNIVHRDLKPANIVLTDSPEENTPKLIDFGLARMVGISQQKLTKTGLLLGSPQYMSPEQCQGKAVDARSDIYSLCVCFYEMLKGNCPYEADTPVALMYLHINQRIPQLQAGDLPRFDPILNEIFKRGLAKSVEDRYPSMTGLYDDVVRLERRLIESTGESKSKGSAIPILVGLCVIVLSGLVFLLAKNILPELQKNRHEESQNANMNLPVNSLMASALKLGWQAGAAERKILFYCRAHDLLKSNEIRISRPIQMDLMFNLTNLLFLEGFPRTSLLLSNEPLAGLQGKMGRSGAGLGLDDYVRDYTYVQITKYRILNVLGKSKEAETCLNEIMASLRRDQAGISKGNKVDLLDTLLATGAHADGATEILNYATSTYISAQLAAIALQHGQTGLVRLALQHGRQLIADAPVIDDQGLLETREAFLAMEMDDLKTARRHLDKAIPLVNRDSIPRNPEVVECLANGLGLVGDSQGLFKILSLYFNPDIKPLNLDAHMSSNALEDLLEKKDGQHSLQIYQYALASKDLSREKLVWMLCRPRPGSNLPEPVMSSLSLYACSMAHLDRELPRALRLDRLNHCAYSLFQLGLPRQAIKFYSEHLQEVAAHGFGESIKNMPSLFQASAVGSRIFLARLYLQIGDKTKATALLNSIAPALIDSPWMYRDIAEIHFGLAQMGKLETLISSCKNISDLYEISLVCRSHHCLQQAQQCVIAGRRLAGQEHSPDRRALDQAYCQICEAQISLESDYPALEQHKRALAELIPRANQLAKATGDLSFLRVLEMTLALVGLQNQAFWMDESCNKLEKLRDSGK